MRDAINEGADAHDSRNCNIPGTGETMAAGRSASAFRREDLPAFGRPRIAHCTPARSRSPRRASLRCAHSSVCNARTSVSTASFTSTLQYSSKAADTRRNQLITKYCTLCTVCVTMYVQKNDPHDSTCKCNNMDIRVYTMFEAVCIELLVLCKVDRRFHIGNALQRCECRFLSRNVIELKAVKNELYERTLRMRARQCS